MIEKCKYCEDYGTRIGHNTCEKAYNKALEEIEKVFAPKEDCLNFLCKKCNIIWSSMERMSVCGDDDCKSKDIVEFIDPDSFKELLQELKKASDNINYAKEKRAEK